MEKKKAITVEKVMKWVPVAAIVVIGISYAISVNNCELKEAIVGLGLFILIADQGWKLFNK